MPYELDKPITKIEEDKLNRSVFSEKLAVDILSMSFYDNFICL